MSPSLPRRAALAALLLAAGAARADESSFRPYLVGSRAAGMGGAFTALADDGSGAWYNPGGLAFVRSSQLSIAGSVYGVVRGSYGDALGDGHDFKYSGLDTLPTATAAIWRLGQEARSADVLSINVFVPDSLRIDDRATLGASSLNTLFFTDQIQTVYAGAAYAHRFGSLGAGVAVFGLLGTRLSQLDVSAVTPGNSASFASITARTDETSYGAMGAVGLRWDPSDDLHLGLAVYSPAVGTGKRRFYGRALAGAVGGAQPQSTVVSAEDLHASPWQPLRVQGGAAVRLGALTLAADLQYLAARTVIDDADRPQFTREIRRQAVLNASLGLEWVAAERFPIRAGLFTDRSAAPGLVAVPSGAPDPNPSNTALLHRTGGTFSVGIRSEHSATDLGLCLSGGTGTDLVPDNLDFSASKVGRTQQLLTYVFLGTSYQF